LDKIFVAPHMILLPLCFHAVMGKLSG